MKHQLITERIINAFYTVYNELGYGFLEKVYRNALYIELSNMGYKAEKEKRIQVYYRDKIVGQYIADLIVEGIITLELKAVECLITEHEQQLFNYLKATKIEVGLLLNFGVKPQIKRRIFDNDYKHIS